MSTSAESVVQSDIEFASIGDTSLKLDLYKPSGLDGPLPTVLWIHGGGFQVGDKADYAERIHPVVAQGYAVASANYRLLDAAPWPAQVHDVKAAVRWLRANANEHGLDPNRIGVVGVSAGGTLASLLGSTAGDADLEGDVGEDTGTSSAVDAVVALFPLSDMVVLSRRSELEAMIIPPSPAAGLLGVQSVDDDIEAVRAASPRFRAHAGSAPHLLIHGDADQVMPFEQSEFLHDALAAAGARSILIKIAGAGHEDENFVKPSVLSAIGGFLSETL